MRILHVPYTFYPDAAGGTEVFVDSLATAQRQAGCITAIAAPADEKSSYQHGSLPVWRFPISPTLTLRDLYGNGDQVAADGFGRILGQFNPDLVHLHAVTSAMSVRLVEQTVVRNIPVVLNYHTPTVSCSRGTLLRWGSAICDGRLELRRCTACSLHGHGLARPLAEVVATIPPRVSRWIGAAGIDGGAWTALQMPDLIEIRMRSLRRLFRMVERIVALCGWTRDLLIRNSVPESKIVLCRQGISWQPAIPPYRPAQTAGLPLRMAFLGRLDPTKGIHVPIQALKMDRSLPLRMDIFGVRQDTTADRYATELKALIADDPRICMRPALGPGEVIPRLGEYDLLIVPSQCLETGPLVVLEAFAAGTPVIGSNLGGIAELVSDGVDGILVDPASSSEAWAQSLRRICSDPALLLSLRDGIREPRRTQQVAVETISLYEEIVAQAGSVPSTVNCQA